MLQTVIKTGASFKETKQVMSVETKGGNKDQSLHALGIVMTLFIGMSLQIKVKTGFSFTETKLAISIETSLYG